MPKHPIPSPDEVNELLKRNDSIGGTYFITFRDSQIGAPLRDIQDSIGLLGTMTPKDRRETMRSVNRAINRHYPKVAAQTASQKVAIRCAQDIAIWFANEVLEGRASLTKN